jgi:uncharacterized protein involved in exopolysaccharide biosynthesis
VKNDGGNNLQPKSDGSTIVEGLGRMVRLIWMRKFLFLLVAIISFTASASVSLLLPEIFTARSSILPSSSSSGLSSIMSSLGSLPMVSDLGLGSSGTHLYPSIAKSDHVVGRILESEFEGVLVSTFLSNGQPADSLSLYLMKYEFKGAISTNINLRNDIVTIEYGHVNNYFAAFVVNSVVENMELYLSMNSDNEVSMQMDTIEIRLQEVTLNMEKSEKELLEFWNKNRSIAQSPTLRIKEQSLLRQQDINSGLFLELVRQRELIKIQSSGAAPILTVLDPAKVPMLRTSPNRVKIVSVSILLSLILTQVFLQVSGQKDRQLRMQVKD